MTFARASDKRTELSGSILWKQCQREFYRPAARASNFALVVTIVTAAILVTAAIPYQIRFMGVVVGVALVGILEFVLTEVSLLF